MRGFAFFADATVLWIELRFVNLSDGIRQLMFWNVRF